MFIMANAKLDFSPSWFQPLSGISLSVTFLPFAVHYNYYFLTKAASAAAAPLCFVVVLARGN